MLKPNLSPAVRKLILVRARMERDAAAPMARAQSARASVKLDAAGAMVATGATGAVAVAVAAVVAVAAANAAKERRVKPQDSRVRCASSMALHKNWLLDMPNRAAYAARGSPPWVNRAKVRAAQAVEIRDESVAMAEAMAELRAILKFVVKVEATAVPMDALKLAAKAVVAAHAAQGATIPPALRQQAIWPRLWVYRAFFPWISRVPPKRSIKRQRRVGERANIASRANAMTAARAEVAATGVTVIADVSAWIKPRAWTTDRRESETTPMHQAWPPT